MTRKALISDVIGIDGPGPMPPDAYGSYVAIYAAVGYPGYRVTDLLIGGHRVQVPNEALYLAAQQHDDNCDLEGG